MMSHPDGSRSWGWLWRGEVFVLRDAGVVVASVTVMDEDPEIWGGRGVDSTAGYVHMLVRDRQRTAPQTGERLLGWGEAEIASRDARWAGWTGSRPTPA